MAQVEEVRKILQRLAPHGWKQLFAAHGLNIEAENLREELGRELTLIDRNINGFFDLSPFCTRGIEPGSPARSLVFHALASATVTQTQDGELTEFPTAAEINRVENFVYAVAERSLEDVRNIAKELSLKIGGAENNSLAIVLLAGEYRTSENTAHGLHADMVYSRTGVCRVGTLEPNYIGSSRGFWPASNKDGIHVIPCAWNAYLCARISASQAELQNTSGFGPMTAVQDDINQDFWVPMHKLFDGTECLAGENLKLEWQIHHENSKIAKVHQFFDKMNVSSLTGEFDLQTAPFKFTEGIATLANQSSLPAGTVVPKPQKSMVEIAKDDMGNPVSFTVPRRKSNANGDIGLFWSSLALQTLDSDRPVPEFLHIRHLIDENGKVMSLNADREMMSTIRAGNYQAVHYIDFTGAGFVTIDLTGISDKIAVKPGFSVVSAPDFYPMVDQRKLLQWYRELQENNPAIAQHIQWGAEPRPLSSIRLSADPDIESTTLAPFTREKDDGTQQTISAVVAMPGEPRAAALNSPAIRVQRCSVLPDAAAGIFAPGWSISTDTTDNVRHLAAYGLGSPFPEDAKLCAALSAFWPAAAPDTTRTYNPTGQSTAPMVDQEIIGDAPWDGIEGNTINFSSSSTTVNFPDVLFADYVESAKENKFDIRSTSQVTFEQYTDRVFRTAQVRDYINKNPRFEIAEFALISFVAVPQNDPVFEEILDQVDKVISGDAYRFLIGVLGQSRRISSDHRRRRAPAKRLLEFVAGENAVVHREGENWDVFEEDVLIV